MRLEKAAGIDLMPGLPGELKKHNKVSVGDKSNWILFKDLLCNYCCLKDVEKEREISLYLTGIVSPMYGSCLKTSMILVRRAWIPLSLTTSLSLSRPAITNGNKTLRSETKFTPVLTLCVLRNATLSERESRGNCLCMLVFSTSFLANRYWACTMR